ncbi:MAG: hypothetical protein FJ012_09405 [Chloroflexi bacterium]|nr:hypothetical protein [Chloroflexota bacterium]
MLVINKQFIEECSAQYDRRNQGTDDQIEERAILNWLFTQGQPKFLNKEYFIRVGRWKTPRYEATREKNDEQKIIEETRSAYLAKKDLEKLNILRRLKGVGTAVASTILYYLQPDKFAIYDYHVRNSLKKAGKLSNGAGGDSSKVWLEYTQIVRKLSGVYGKTLREVEKALFAYDKWGCGENEADDKTEAETMEQNEGLRVPLPKDKIEQLNSIATNEFGTDGATLAKFWIIDHLCQLGVSGKSHTVPLSPDVGSQTTALGPPPSFQGEIVDQRGKDRGNWARRGITVPKNSSGAYPQPGHKITVIDTGGKKYQLKFTKSRNPVKVYLGQPSKLKGWYQKRYPSNSVVPDNVYFEYTGPGHTYRIYTSKEWTGKATQLRRKP